MVECLYNLDVSTALRYFLGIVNLIQGFAATFGNILVILLVFGNKRLRTRSNAFLVSLAISDFLVGVLLEPLFVAQFFSQGLRENCGFNKIRRYLSSLLMGASVGSIAVVSYDRWTHLSKTIRYKEFMPKKKVIILLIIVWLIPITVPFVRFTSEAVYSSIIIIYILFIVALMITCYLVIIDMVRSREKSLHKNIEIRSRAKETTNHIRAAKAIILVIVCLLATFLPISIYHGLTAVNSLSTGSIKISEDTKEICYAILMTIGLTNSGINPVIYYFRIPEFRSSMRGLFSRLCRRGLREISRSAAEESHETSI